MLSSLTHLAIATAGLALAVAASNSPAGELYITEPHACDDCIVIAGIEDPSEHLVSSSALSEGGKIKRSLATPTSPPLTSLIVFNAYLTASAFSSNGHCVTTPGTSATTLSRPYSFTVNTLLPSSIIQSSAISAFAAYLGFSACSGGAEPSQTSVNSLIPSSTQLFNSSVTSTLSSLQTSPSAPTQLFNTSVTSTLSSLPSAPTVQSQKASTSLSPRTKIGIGIGVSTGGTIVFFLALRDILRYRKRKNGDQAEKQESTSEEHQPYFQQKGELEAQERRKYELEAAERRYELEENMINEMPTLEMDDDRSAHQRQELRGEEHCKELKGSES